MPNWNLATVFESVCDALPDRTAIVQGERRHTWTAFDERASRFAGALAAHGVQPDSKVALYLYNSNEFMEAMYGSLKARAVHVNVNYRYLADELAYLLDNADAEVLVFHGTLAEHVAEARDRLPKLRLVVQVDDGSPLLEGAVPFETLLAAHEPAPRIGRSGDDLWFLYTGGTTGMPKGVMWRNEDFYGSLGENTYPLFGETLPDTSADAGAAAARIAASGLSPTHLPASPLMHGTGAMTTIQSLFLGGSIVTLESRHFDADELWRTVAREQVSQLAIVGDAFAKPMVRALEQAEGRGEPYDLSAVRLIISSGVIWSAELKAELQARQPMLLLDSLGSSEGIGFASSITAPGDTARTARFRVGPRTKVLTEDGRDVRPGSGEQGMLALGGHLPAGYYKDPGKSAATFRVFDGARYSVPGDWATVDDDGTITLLGRGSVCINSGGEKIYPEEVEEAIKLDPTIADCVAVGVPDDRWGEAVTAVVAAEPGATVDPEQLKAAGAALARFKRPRHIVVVDEIRRGPNGKVDYGWARATAAARVAETA
ncbi:MAG TPA: acyl-CoA synthetase [Acidimicrobiia bacterium]|nr:acyl-CoA synthetase [Acidimicrobiia bacterium]